MGLQTGVHARMSMCVCCGMLNPLAATGLQADLHDGCRGLDWQFWFSGCGYRVATWLLYSCSFVVVCRNTTGICSIGTEGQSRIVAGFCVVRGCRACLSMPVWVGLCWPERVAAWLLALCVSPVCQAWHACSTNPLRAFMLVAFCSTNCLQSCLS